MWILFDLYHQRICKNKVEVTYTVTPCMSDRKHPENHDLTLELSIYYN